MEKGRQKASKIAPKMNQKTYKKHPEKNNQEQIATKDEKYGFWRSRGVGVQPPTNEPFGASGPHLVHIGSATVFWPHFALQNCTPGTPRKVSKIMRMRPGDAHPKIPRKNIRLQGATQNGKTMPKGIHNCSKIAPQHINTSKTSQNVSEKASENLPEKFHKQTCTPYCTHKESL